MFRILSKSSRRCLYSQRPFFFSETQNSRPKPDFEKITKLSSEINKLYLKRPIETKAPVVEKVKKTKEEINKDTNQNVISREIGNDVAQIPLKWLAFYCSNPANQGPFWAELTRSSIDAINHLILYITNYFGLGPSLKYPYAFLFALKGTDKVKNFVVMIPAGLFFVFGTNIIYHSVLNLITGSYKLEEIAGMAETSSFLTLAVLPIYLLSIGIESYVVYNNINDVVKLQGGQTKNQSFINKLKMLGKKKDPLLEAVLFENFITFNSTLIPMIVAVINMFVPNYLFAELGSASIGIIQWYLGYQLMTRNIPNLIGQGVEEEILNDIISIIKNNPYVLSLNQAKGVNTGTHKFRFSTNIVFNEEKIKNELVEDLEERFDRITFEPRHDDRGDELSELVSNMPKKLLNEIRIQQTKIEEAIISKYPDCEDCHLEIDTEKEEYQMDADEFTKDHLNISTKIEMQALKEEINRLIKGDFMFDERTKKRLKTEQSYPFLNVEQVRRSYDFVFTETDYDYIEENMCCNEDFRFEMIKNQLEGKNKTP